MTKFKKVILGSIILGVMVLSAVVGLLIFNKESQPTTLPNNRITTQATSNTVPTTYYFKEGEVLMKSGENNIDYNYQPQNNVTSGKSVAYEYIFANSMDVKMAVKLQTQLSIEGVTVSYQWSASKIENITESKSKFITQPISVSGKAYLYIILTPTDINSLVSYTGTITWKMGKAGELNIIAGTNTEPQVYTFIKGEQVTEEDIGTPTVEEGCAFAGWYADNLYQTIPKFETLKSGSTIYAKIGAALPDDWYEYYNGSYRVIKGSTPLTGLKSTDIIIPERYQKEGYPEADVTSIYSSYSSSGVFKNQTTITSVQLPNTITSISKEAFYGCTNLKSIDIQEGVTSIGGYAFFKCTSLTSIDLPRGLTSIQQYSFYGCSSLTDVTISSGVTSIEMYAFRECRALVSISLPASLTTIGNYAFTYCSAIENVYLEDVDAWCRIKDSSKLLSEARGANIYVNNQPLTRVDIPQDVTTISSYLFYKCETLLEVNIHAGVTSIGNSAFTSCTSLVSVNIEDNSQLTSFDGFYNCSSLQRINFGANSKIETLGGLGSCTSLTSIEIPSTVTKITGSAFSKSGITSVDIPRGVTLIDRYTFDGCANLTSIFIHNQITIIDDYAFQNCTNLQSVEFEANSQLTSTGGAVFNGCSNLKSVYIHDIQSFCKIDFGGSTSNPLNYGATLYLNNKPLTDIVIPDGVKIGTYAFYNYKQLTNISIPDSVPSVGNYAFGGCDNLVKTTYDNATYLGNPNNPYVVLISAVNTKITSCEIHHNTRIIYGSAFRACYDLATINPIPSGIISIGTEAFHWAGITSLTFEENSQLTIIGASAFQACSKIASVTIPSSVTSIGLGAFEFCYGLNNVTISSNEITIGSTAFSSCNALFEVYNLSSTLNISIGSKDNGYIGYYALAVYTDPNAPSRIIAIDNVRYFKESDTSYFAIGMVDETQSTIALDSKTTKIYSNAFEKTSLTNITIPEGVTSIGKSAFSQCTKLTAVTLPSTLTSIGSSAFYGCNYLTSIVIPSGVTVIESSTFYDCTSLSSVVIPNTVTTINSEAFSRCYRLASIELPSSITTIADYAFYTCTALKTITIHAETPPTLKGTTRAIPSQVTTIYIPKGTLSAYQSATNWKTFSTKFVEMD